MENERASSGHKLGQLIGDWYEKYFVLLRDIATNKGTAADGLGASRCRLSRILVGIGQQ